MSEPCARCGHLEHEAACVVLVSAMVGYHASPDFEGDAGWRAEPRIVHTPCGCAGEAERLVILSGHATWMVHGGYLSPEDID